MNTVYCIGELLIDFVAEKQGSDLSKALQFTKKAGGAPANVACTIAKLGGKSSFIGVTTLAFVSLAEDGERDFIFNRGADKKLKYDPAIKKNFKKNILHLGAATALLGLWRDDEETFIKKCMPFIQKSHLCKFSLEEAQLLSGKQDLNEACDVLHEIGTQLIPQALETLL